MKKTTHTPHRPLTQLLALALCITMCVPVGLTMAASHPGTPTTLTYTYKFAQPTLTPQTLLGQTYSRIVLPGAIGMGKNIGGPTIPVTWVKLALPPMTTVDSLTITGDAVTVSTNGVLSQQPVIPFQKDIPAGTPAPTEITYDPALYQLSTPYPATVYDNYDIGYCRGYAILSIALTSVQYVPAQGTLLYHPQLTVTINLKSAPMNQFFRNKADDASYVQRLVSNPEVVQTYRNLNYQPVKYIGGLCDSREQHQYVIITTTQNGLDGWVTNDTLPYNWDSLMTAHADLSPVTVTYQDILANPAYYNSTPMFNDTQARLRNFCRDAYQNWGAEYILIGAGQFIPSRLMDYAYESGVDADLYFSNLDNSFNADQDYQWGEEGDAGFDLYSEMAIGRLTAKHPIDISNWMTKSFNYAHQGDPNILDNGAFYGGEMGWTIGGDELEQWCAIDNVTDWSGPNPDEHGVYPTWLGYLYGFYTWNLLYSGIPYNISTRWTAESSPIPGWQGGSQSAATQGLKNAINADQVSFISGVAHADPTMSLDVYMQDWETYHNAHPFYISDWGCHCGDWDAQEVGILDTMLFDSNTYRSFGCTYNTGYGWGAFQTTNTSSALQQKLFWDYFLDTQNNSGSPANWQLGVAHAFARDEMAPTIDWVYSAAPGAWRGVIQCCTLFADPAQEFRTPRENHAPADPAAPVGPDKGTVAISYDFTAVTTDPDNDSLLYMFDWGDGTNSGWLGPFDSGVVATGSHIWTSGGNFSVTVQAKDFIGATTAVSSPSIIKIGAPILEIQKLKGGLGIKMVLNNAGEGAAKVDWRVTITGGLGNMLSLQNFGNLPSLDVNTPTTVKLYPAFFGFGKLKINIKATAVYGNSLNENYTGFILGLVVFTHA